MAFLFKRAPADPGARLRELIKDDTIVAPGVFGPIFALLAERMGFKALYLSGAALTGFHAMPDIGLITLTELTQSLRGIARVTDLPVIVDADTGFGEAVNVMRAVRDLEEAGAAAIQIEDQVMPKKCGHLPGKALVTAEEMMKKIRAAVEARRGEMMVIARTDARDVEGLEGAIERAKLYLEAGADAIFPEALRSIEEFREFSKHVKAPLVANMTEFGKTPYITVGEFKEAGYRIVIFPVTLLRASLWASREALRRIAQEGTQRGFLDMLMTRQEFYEMIGYSRYEEVDSMIAKDVEERLKRRAERKGG